MPKNGIPDFTDCSSSASFLRLQAKLSAEYVHYAAKEANVKFSRDEVDQMEEHLGLLQCELANVAWEVVTENDNSWSGIRAKARVLLEYAENDDGDLVHVAARALAHCLLDVV